MGPKKQVQYTTSQSLHPNFPQYGYETANTKLHGISVYQLMRCISVYQLMHYISVYQLMCCISVYQLMHKFPLQVLTRFNT